MTTIRQYGRRALKFIVYWWEKTQVELHGRFSEEQVQDLRVFLSNTSFAEAAAICLTLPLPVMIVLAALETIPLEPPSAGTHANYGFWIRHTVTLITLSPGVISNFRFFLPEMNITRTASVLIGVVGSVASAASAYLVSLFIGFPVPFTLLVSAPGWIAAVIPPTVSIYRSRMRHDRQLLMKFIRCWCVVGWFAVLVMLYPLYVFGFHRLSPLAQIFYVGILPMIKITARNVISWLIGDRHNVKAEMVIFNVEVFSAMYISVALQDTAKLTTTMAVMVVDIIQLVVAVSDVSKMVIGIDRIAKAITPNRAPFRVMIFADERPLSKRSRRTFLKRSTRVGPTLLPGKSLSSLAKILPTPADPKNETKDPKPTSPIRNTISGGHYTPPPGTRKYSFINHLPKKDREQLASQSAQILFTSVFVLLVKYVEAVIPAIYAGFVVISYSSPNRPYYGQFDSITTSNLNITVLNIVLYCFLKILSFALMCVILGRKLGMSAIHLVAFLLAYQWEAVFTKTLTWVTYTTLTSLKHSGPDFTFQFAWLRHSPRQ